MPFALVFLHCHSIMIPKENDSKGASVGQIQTKKTGREEGVEEEVPAVGEVCPLSLPCEHTQK